MSSAYRKLQTPPRHPNALTEHMDSSPTHAIPMALAIYGCELDESLVFREKAPSFGITPVITAAPVSASTIHLAAGHRCISVGHKTPISNSDLLALSDAGVEYISTRSIGFNHIDVAYARSVGISVENVAYSADSVADYTLMLTLMAVRHAKYTVRQVDIHDYRLQGVRGRELRDLTVGVVGTGRIGAAVIDRLRGFGCRVIACDDRETVAVDYVSLDELLERSDIVTLHVPLDQSTHHLLDGRRIGQMKDGAYLVNTGRGSLVDTEALLTALENGKLGGAGLDVVEGEDGVFYSDRGAIPIEDPVLLRLHKLPNALITPHIAYYTDHALIDTVVNSLINCLRFEKGLKHG
ncbi:MAG: lactate dehydrogenase [Glaciihabitans sp.]|nr:lactate dehydrogenase [Glaciihabitans sp.]